MDLKNKFDLGFFPTPLHQLKNLSKEFSSYQLFIKRDDQTGLASGGNKTRKLEYLIRKALDEKCDTVITAGAQQSNHCRQTVAACAIAGLECHLLLAGNEPKDYNGNLLLSHLLGAKIHFTGENRKGEDIQNLKSELEINNKKVSIIPYGGSNLLGALGYINAVKELKVQLKELSLDMDYIFFASSSGATQAGMMIGMDVFGLDAKLIPINIDKAETAGFLENIVLELIHESKQFFHLHKEYRIADIPLDRNYDKAGYGNLTGDEKEAIKILAQTEGIILDPVYTGRAFYGMLDYLNKKKLKDNSNILFWHTGGFPANFNYGKELF
ncbi:MAG: D-cysteine desulfhydrase family protein [Flavobacteriaceae bacterium]|nr:D-cysteine desulfhydrase family protein [Flavobacteriaceae bacterium]